VNPFRQWRTSSTPRPYLAGPKQHGTTSEPQQAARPQIAIIASAKSEWVVRKVRCGISIGPCAAIRSLISDFVIPAQSLPPRRRGAGIQRFGTKRLDSRLRGNDIARGRPHLPCSSQSYGNDYAQARKLRTSGLIPRVQWGLRFASRAWIHVLIVFCAKLRTHTSESRNRHQCGLSCEFRLKCGPAGMFGV
jgi:hypothetical protein